MTLQEAIEIRSQQLQGIPVKALDLQEALVLIQERPRRKPGRPYKFRLPVLSKDDRDRMNGMLLLQLGRLQGRAEALA